jgi:hypothetical protein
LATVQPPSLTSFREPNGAVMTANMKRLGWKRRIGASSLRGLQGRSATNQNGQAAKENKEKISSGLDAAKTFLASGSGRSVFRLTSPCIGLPGCPIREQWTIALLPQLNVKNPAALVPGPPERATRRHIKAPSATWRTQPTPSSMYPGFYRDRKAFAFEFRSS